VSYVDQQRSSVAVKCREEARHISGHGHKNRIRGKELDGLGIYRDLSGLCDLCVSAKWQ
jgi:hypothetical protein